MTEALVETVLTPFYGNDAVRLNREGAMSSQGPVHDMSHGAIYICTTNKEGDAKKCGPCKLQANCRYFNSQNPTT